MEYGNEGFKKVCWSTWGLENPEDWAGVGLHLMVISGRCWDQGDNRDCCQEEEVKMATSGLGLFQEDVSQLVNLLSSCLTTT